MTEWSDTRKGSEQGCKKGHCQILRTKEERATDFALKVETSETAVSVELREGSQISLGYGGSQCRGNRGN